ncbi:MAG: phytanoyl-CoA dioxygenase [Actinomycetota bacterium]|nr:phytanoyl-CoA dioxygenase [Actinomycetota bacterium]
MSLDTERFVRDGFAAVRGAFDPGVAAACRAAIWGDLGGQGVVEDDRASWPSVLHIDCGKGDVFSAAGTSPVPAAAYDELIGRGRWTRPVDAGGAIVVRFPSEDRAEAGYHIEGSYGGPGGYWVNVRSRARGLLALLLLSDVGPDDAPPRLVCRSHLYVPELLASYGEAGTNADAELWRPSVLCRPVAHATGRPATPSCATRSWCTPPPGRTEAPGRA